MSRRSFLFGLPIREDRSSPTKEHAWKPKMKKAKSSPKKSEERIAKDRSFPKNNDNRPVGEVSAVPDPAPEDNENLGLASPSAEIYTSPLFPPLKTTTRNLVLSSRTANLLLPSVSIAPGPIVVTTISLTSVFLSATTPSFPSPTSDVDEHAPQSSSPHHFSTVIITLLAVGGAFILAAGFIILRLCTRTRKRTHPTPSLPILQEFPSQKFDDESPIFGGKERFSSASPGSSAVLWPWTQYQSGIPRPPPVANKHADASVMASYGQRSLSDEKEGLSSSYQSAAVQKAANMISAQSTFWHQGTANHRPSRLSTLSTSMRPASTYTNGPAPDTIGIAVSSEHIPIAEDDSNSAGVADQITAQEAGRKANARRSLERKRASQVAGDSLLYGGAEITSPSMPGSVAPGYAQGRARIKAPYGAGSYLRSSSTATSGNAGTRVSSVFTENPFDDSAYGVPPIPPLRKSLDGQAGGGTKALTMALGLKSPLPSQEPSLDSSSRSARLVLDRKKVPLSTKIESSEMEASASLGSMMLSDYRASRIVDPSSTMHAHSEAALESPTDSFSTSFRRRADDKPPRVPSPPLLPSLAQMALAHNNPDDYANYNSPTYSIYGLYDPDRKSRPDGGY
ncbi:hypothetical protein EW146_g727 [Bondarzewia mesenterica]|uniref:Uncharacterized protein n=1 Tax=Bondarzewia mesenterica TaxID=1095465 RepID=A0A4S4M644_9AGAM|nr:hypothetical protein EW146_g727 [Bondarzewia mesenterica]